MTGLTIRLGFILAVAMLPLLIMLSMGMRFNHWITGLIIAWLLTFIAISIAVDFFIIRHLRPIRQAASDISEGNLDARVAALKNPPTVILDLKNQIDSMAESLSRQKAQLLDNLDEQERLLKDIHHRVKNNLQVITSLLNLQERRYKSEDKLEIILEIRNRIHALTAAHGDIYEIGSTQTMDVRQLIVELFGGLKYSLNLSRRNIDVKTDIVSKDISRDLATMLGLYIVECMTYAVGYSGHEGERVHLTIEAKDETMTVKVRIDRDFNPDENQAISIKLMRGFSRQLCGEFEIARTGHDQTLSISFPIEA